MSQEKLKNTMMNLMTKVVTLPSKEHLKILEKKVDLLSKEVKKKKNTKQAKLKKKVNITVNI